MKSLVYRKLFSFILTRKKMKPLLIDLYKKVAIKELPIYTETINVKKGKAKYTLVFLVDAKGKKKINIGRHKANVVEYL